jgi:hypothetical protein
MTTTLFDLFTNTPPFVPPRLPLREKIAISFSGGATSGFMLKMLLDHFRTHEPDRKVAVTFCNTGLEHPRTLDFVNQCDKEFRADVVWLEAVVTHGQRVGIRHKIVTYETASRNGEPFEEYIKKHGIPNTMYKQCNSRLKTEVMDDYRASIGWHPDDYSTAVGIRADEIDRISSKGMAKGIFYPCADAGITKADVKAWWRQQSFWLDVPEHLGNCLTCWKKSLRKLLTIAKETPEAFDFMDRMEKTYPLAGGERRDGQPRQPRTFFRENRSAQDILRMAQEPFEPFSDDRFIPYNADLDVGGGCGDSCEIGADED